MFRYLAVIAILTLANASAGMLPLEQASQALKQSSKEDKRKWMGLWPSLTEAAIAEGYDLPLPFGISANYIYLRRNIEVKEVKAGLNGSLNDVSNYLAVETENDVQTGLIRFDAFLLPFLNIYGFGGTIKNQSAVDLTITVPGIGGRPITRNVQVNPDLTADIWGAGANLSGGYKNFFISLDATYSATDLGGAFSDSVEVWIFASRLGYRGSIRGKTTTFFTGAAYWDSETVISGSLPLGANTLDFDVLQGPENPWNALIGCAIDLSDRWQVQAEWDFNFEDMNMAILGASYRF
jgi:hypothetical protein